MKIEYQRWTDSKLHKFIILTFTLYCVPARKLTQELYSCGSEHEETVLVISKTRLQSEEIVSLIQPAFHSYLSRQDKVHKIQIQRLNSRSHERAIVIYFFRKNRKTRNQSQ